MKSLDGFVFVSHGLKVERMDFFEFLFFYFLERIYDDVKDEGCIDEWWIWEFY